MSQAYNYNTAIGTNLETPHDHPLELNLQYLSEIKALISSITMLLANYNTFKAILASNSPAMLKMLSSDGPIIATHPWLQPYSTILSFFYSSNLFFEMKKSLRLGEMLEEA